MMRFEFFGAPRILFGAGAWEQAAAAAAGIGHKIFVVSGKSPERAAPLTAKLEAAGAVVTRYSVCGEPTTETASEAVEVARGQECDVVVALGGGSVVDLGKVVAAMLTNTGALMDYLEVIGWGRVMEKASAPLIAIPTTAGTGSEVTRNAVLGSPMHGVKVSMRSTFLQPRLAVVDPTLTYSLPLEITATTGLDAVTQLLEAFVSSKANPMTDSFCREGLRHAAPALLRLRRDLGDKKAREDMALAALFSGLALANAGLGAVHGFAGPLGGMFPAAHGAVCACLLPHVLMANIRALRERSPGNSALEKYREFAAMATETPEARAEDAAEWAEQLVAKLPIAPLSRYGIGEADIPEIVAKARQASSMKGNPIGLTEAELTEIVRRACEGGKRGGEV